MQPASVLGIIGLGAVLAHSGAGTMLAWAVMSIVPFGGDQTALNYGLLYLVGTVLGLATNQLALPAVLTPLAGEFVAASGLPLYTDRRRQFDPVAAL